MTQAAPASTRPMNRKERRQAAKKSKRRKGSAASNPLAGAVELVDQSIQKAAQFHRAGKLDRAESLYRDALRRNPDNPDVRHLLGGMLASQGRHEEAIEHLTAARIFQPDNPKVHYNLAFAYSLANRIDEAEVCYQDALRLKPDYLEALKGLSAIRQRTNGGSAAVEPLRAAHQFHPDNPALHKTLALLLQSLGRQAEATEHFQRVSELCPNDVESLTLLAISHRERGAIEDAAAILAQALAKDPENQSVRSRLALFVCELGKPDVALNLALEALDKSPDLMLAHIAFSQAIPHAAPVSYDKAFEDALCLAFDHDHCRHAELGRPAINTLQQKYNEVARQQSDQQDGSGAASNEPQQVRLDGFMTDGLLLRLLEKTKVSDSFFERLLTSIRRAILQATPNQPSLSTEARRFIAALARHCHENSYAYSIAKEERAAVEILKGSLRQEIDRLPDSLPVLECRLSLIALYEPLIALREAEELGRRPLDSWSEEMRALIKASLCNPLRELDIRGAIESVTDIEDEVSKEVREQYESNPYPRWWHSQTSMPVAFVRSLNLQVQGFEPPAFLNEPLEILVAGCGTGQHPISIACQTNDCQILAIDLSRASLAYASRMAEEIGVKNITFRQGDILSLSCLDRQFPVIECAGVLHHMKEPEAGLATLVELLRPQGLIKLGLYSEIARASVVEARKRIAELGLATGADDIRAFRQRILRNEPGYEPLQDLLQSSDFYDLDGARDLLFHVQEHRYTIPQLADMLERHRLRFLGFAFPRNETKLAYAERFPNDPNMVDLSSWQVFEEENPDTFRGMYQFWCQKRD